MKEMSVRPQAVESRRLAAEGLFALLGRKPFADVTISDICRQSGIARQTFYRNFSTKEDVVTWYVDGVIADFMGRVEGVREKDLKLFFCNLPFSPGVLRKLKENNIMYLMRNAMLDMICRFMETEAWQPKQTGACFESYYARYLADTVISVLGTWADRNFEETGDELLGIMLELIRGPC